MVILDVIGMHNISTLKMNIASKSIYTLKAILGNPKI